MTHFPNYWRDCNFNIPSLSSHDQYGSFFISKSPVLLAYSWILLYCRWGLVIETCPTPGKSMQVKTVHEHPSAPAHGHIHTAFILLMVLHHLQNCIQRRSWHSWEWYNIWRSKLNRWEECWGRAGAQTASGEEGGVSQRREVSPWQHWHPACLSYTPAPSSLTTPVSHPTLQEPPR